MDSAAWDARYSTSELMWSAEPNLWVAGELAELPPGRAIDLGAGEARNSIWLAGLGWQVTAADFSTVALSKGRRAAQACGDGRAERISWLDADLLDYVPEPGSVDLAVIAYLQLPAAGRRLVVHRAVRALTPGGTLLVVGHDSSNPAEGTGGPQEAAVLFTPEDVVADLATSGVTLRVERAERVHRRVDGSDRPAIDALVRATALGE
jgi:SAM-dependent methyltransferase